MPVTDIHLLTLLQRLDVIRENLHLRPLTSREVEDIVKAAGFSTTTPGLINVIYNRPKKKAKRLYTRPKQVVKEEKFKFNVKDKFIVNTRRTYKYEHDLIVDTPVKKKIKQSVNVLTPLTVNGVNSLTVITNLDTVVLEKIIILTKIIYKSLEKISISTFLKNTLLNALKISTGLKLRLKNKLKVSSPLELTELRERLENQSVYMGDVGQIEEIELVQILGDIDALR